MKIVIIGGTGLIGSKTAVRLRQKGHEVVAASPNTGVNTITGEGLAEALNDAAVVIDLANSPSFEDKAVLEFFETSGKNLMAAEKKAGVKHHVALSIVGTDRLSESGYLRAKVAQEAIIRQAGIPYTILRSTQFMEFLGGIAQAGTVGGSTHLSTGNLQPIASDDVADFVAEAALAAPADSIIEIAGPERARLCDFVARYLKAIGDSRTVVPDPDARYFGTRLEAGSLVSDNNPRIGRIDFDRWFATAPRK
ncbi:SDR family oxidoreductase [Bosea sp. UNC402CLCol]|uniref:SDR family oxidoreductase n=1 Tax=Bosea sp. UNC402CLCol TaxID=1510531 RepID=UPI00056DE579|nr:SDR family oxidoreductase [Bosea sp. UNC402CLCol]